MQPALVAKQAHHRARVLPTGQRQEATFALTLWGISHYLVSVTPDLNWRF
jgi:hypothetical protein